MVRTFKRLYPQIYDFDNLWLAWRRARRGGKRSWPTVAAFEVRSRGAEHPLMRSGIRFRIWLTLLHEVR